MHEYDITRCASRKRVQHKQKKGHSLVFEKIRAVLIELLVLKNLILLDFSRDFFLLPDFPVFVPKYVKAT